MCLCVCVHFGCEAVSNIMGNDDRRLSMRSSSTLRAPACQPIRIPKVQNQLFRTLFVSRWPICLWTNRLHARERVNRKVLARPPKIREHSRRTMCANTGRIVCFLTLLRTMGRAGCSLLPSLCGRRHEKSGRFFAVFAGARPQKTN